MPSSPQSMVVCERRETERDRYPVRSGVVAHSVRVTGMVSETIVAILFRYCFSLGVSQSIYYS